MVATRSSKNTKKKTTAAGSSSRSAGGSGSVSNRKKSAVQQRAGNDDNKKQPPPPKQPPQPASRSQQAASSAASSSPTAAGVAAPVAASGSTGTGTIAPELMQRAMSTGLSRSYIVNAVTVAREREAQQRLQRMQRMQTWRTQQQQQQQQQALTHQRTSSSSSSSTSTPPLLPFLQHIPLDIWCSTLISYLDFHTDVPNLLNIHNRRLHQLIDHEDIYKSFAQRMYPSRCLSLTPTAVPSKEQDDTSSPTKKIGRHNESPPALKMSQAVVEEPEEEDDRKLPAVSEETPTESVSLVPPQRTQVLPKNYKSWKECVMDQNSRNAVLVRRLVDRGFQARRRYKVLLRSTLMLDSEDDVIICKLEVDHELKRPLNQRGRSALIRTTYDALKQTKVVRATTTYGETTLPDPLSYRLGSRFSSSGSDNNNRKKRKRSNTEKNDELVPCEPSSGTWNCHECTFPNYGSESSCIICATVRSSRIQRRRLQQQRQQPRRQELQNNIRPTRSTSSRTRPKSTATAPQGSGAAASLKTPPSYSTVSSPTMEAVTANAPPPGQVNTIASRTRSKKVSSSTTSTTNRQRKAVETMRGKRRQQGLMSVFGDDAFQFRPFTRKKKTLEERIVSTELKPIHKYLETLEQSSTSVRHVFLLVFKASDFLPNSDYTLDYPFGRSPKVWLEKVQFQGPSLHDDLFSLSSPLPQQQSQLQSQPLPGPSVDHPPRRSSERRDHRRSVVTGQEVVAPLGPAADVDVARRTRNGNLSVGNYNNDNNASAIANRFSLALSAVHNTGGLAAIMVPRDGTLHKSWRTRYLRGLRAEEDDDDESLIPDLESVEDEEEGEDANDDRSDVAVVQRRPAAVADAEPEAERERERRQVALHVPVLRAAAGGARERRRRRRDLRRQEQDAVGHVIAGVLGVAAAAADAGVAEPRPDAGGGVNVGRLLNAANAAVAPDRGAGNNNAGDATGRAGRPRGRNPAGAGAVNRAINAGGRIAAAVAEAAGVPQPAPPRPLQQGNRGNEMNLNDGDDHNDDMVRYVVSSRLPPLRPLLHIGRGTEGARLFHVEPPPRVDPPQQNAHAAAAAAPENGAGNLRDNGRNNPGAPQLQEGGDAGEPNDLSNITHSIDGIESMDEHIMRPLGGGRIRVQRFDVQPDVHDFFRRAAAAAAGGGAGQPVAAGGAAGHVAANNPPPAGAAGGGNADDGNNNNNNRNDGANPQVDHAGRRGARRMLLRIQLGQGGVAAIAADADVRLAGQGQGNGQQEQAGQLGEGQAAPVVAPPREQNAAGAWRQPGDDGADLMIPGALANLIPNMAAGQLLIRAGNPANNEAVAAANRNNGNNDRPRRGQNRQDEVGARIRRNLPARAAARGARRRVARILGGPMAEALEAAVQRGVDNAHRFAAGAAEATGAERPLGRNQGLDIDPGRSDRDERARRRHLRTRRVELAQRRDEQRERIREIEQNVERERQRNRRLRVRLAELQAQVRVLEDFRNGRGDQQPQQNPPRPPDFV
eukprot:CAMPEP_0113473286 /NCGR_PEP_ID=MMETSP0014_2-20120614/17967_1 /TAXON_ID=2857 /ORGANISM="Nitzschia sp." /LENGTH=1498 /DNA_ID=CAMNT_0000366051 /DNA_START=480 /DNA_END=4976 /DNA_ORIENTATION=- /assembly_acc=CAM_ASM_000159